MTAAGAVRNKEAEDRTKKEIVERVAQL